MANLITIALCKKNTDLTDDAAITQNGTILLQVANADFLVDVLNSLSALEGQVAILNIDSVLTVTSQLAYNRTEITESNKDQVISIDGLEYNPVHLKLAMIYETLEHATDLVLDNLDQMLVVKVTEQN